MGFGSVAAQIIMFISLMSVTTGVLIIFDQHAQETTQAMTLRTNALASSLKTDFTITSVSYNSTLNWTFVYVLNTGSTELVTNQTDILMNGLFIPRDERKNITVVDSTEVRNPLTWDPNEVIEIIVNKTFAPNATHVVDIVSQFGVRKSDTFSWS